MADTHDQPPIIKATNEARQGVTGNHVRTVLTVSLAAVVVLFGAIYLYYFGH
jgi:hypothetical protein